jgi:hypothetical protein
MRIKKVSGASKHALPSCLFQEGLAVPRLDGPVRDGYANVVEACTGDLGKILLGLRFSMTISTISMISFGRTMKVL